MKKNVYKMDKRRGIGRKEQDEQEEEEGEGR